jgi:hypothetical protein
MSANGHGGGLAGPNNADAASAQPNPVAEFVNAGQMHLRRALDRAAPHVAPRWMTLAALAALYAVRVLLLRGFYIVTYGLGIYNLNLLLGFITPAVDPESEEGAGPDLPTKSDQEFRPFVRRLPEFKFWWASLRSVAVGFALTFFPPADLPVFWPILLVYWVALFAVTMRRQIKHMVKHKYLPFDLHKPRAGGSRGGGGGGAGGGGGRKGGD